MNFKNLSIGINQCLQCGSFVVRTSMLCQVCEDTLMAKANYPDLFHNEVRKISCASLFLWRRDKNRILNRVSLALKGGREIPAWKYYAEKFAQHWLVHDVLVKNAVLVPCPSKNGVPDHASLFADELSAFTGIPVKRLLKRMDVKEQKQMSRQEREAGVASKFSLCSITNEKFSKIYFVDDIITTGTTLVAAQSLLKRFLEKHGHVKGISLIIRE